MTTRDRSEDFKRERNKYHSVPNHIFSPRFGDTSSSSSSSSPSQHGGSVAISIPPSWSNNVSDIEHGINKIQLAIDELDSLHKRHALPEITDRFDDEQVIGIKTAEITTMFKRTNDKISKMAEIPRLSKDEKKLIKNLQNKYAKQLLDITINFRKSQRYYLQKIQTSDSSDYDPFAFNKEEEDIFFDPGFTQDQLDISKWQNKMTEEYALEAKNVLASIFELNQMFQDISLLVIEQGSLLDRIDQNIESSVHNVEVAYQTLVKVKRSAESSTSKKCIMLLCIAVIGVFVILLVKLFLSSFFDALIP